MLLQWMSITTETLVIASGCTTFILLEPFHLTTHSILLPQTRMRSYFSYHAHWLPFEINCKILHRPQYGNGKDWFVFRFFPIFVTSHYIKSDNWIISLLFAYHLFDWIFIYTRVSASHKTVFIFVWSMHSSSLILLSQFNIAECKCNSFFLSSTFNVEHTQKTI